MFQFGRSRFLSLCIQDKDSGFYSHWVAPFGYLRVNAFFQLAEAFRRLRVLHRLLMPRHPPAALNSLTKKFVKLSCSIIMKNFLQASIYVSDLESYALNFRSDSNSNILSHSLLRCYLDHLRVHLPYFSARSIFYNRCLFDS